MRKWFVISFTLAQSLSIAAMADDAAVKKQIQADFNKAMAALQKHDMKGFMAFVANDYQFSSPEMKVGKTYIEQTMKYYANGTNKIHSFSYDIADLKSSGNTATGKATFTLDSTVRDDQGVMGKLGKTHRMHYAQLFAATWVKSGGRWQRSREAMIGKPKMTVDGKPYDPLAKPAGAR